MKEWNADQIDAMIEWDQRHEWQGERRLWVYGEPCPAQMRDRLAPEWRHFDAAGQPFFVPDGRI